MKIELNKLRDRAYKIACDKGFHDKELSNEHFLCLVISELMEAVEADRKGKRADVEAMQCTIDAGGFCPGVFKEYIKDTVEDELADAVIRLLDLYGLRGIELNEDAFSEKTIREYASYYEPRSFPEAIYSIVGQMASPHYSVDNSAVLPEILLLEVLGIAKHLHICLEWHIEQKMKYNELRNKMHGKKY